MMYRPRRGFTIIELLVVVAILGLLSALLLPAIQAARESARSATCKNNLRQIGFALNNYQLAFGMFPPQRSNSPDTCWSIYILSFIDQPTLYDQYNHHVAWDHPTNQGVINTRIPVFLCPSTPDTNHRWDRLSSQLTAAPGDYAPPSSVSAQLVASGLIPPRSSLRGLLVAGNGTPARDVLDGLSNTLLFTEDAGRPIFYAKNRLGPSDNVPGGGNLPVIGGRVRGASWADPTNGIPLHGFSPDGLKAPGPCPINCTNNNEAYSFHVDGIHVNMGDGSTRFLSEKMTIDAYASLITAQGDEIPDHGSL